VHKSASGQPWKRRSKSYKIRRPPTVIKVRF